MTRLVMKNISYAYGQERVLKNVDLTARSGEVVALVGPNGAGKSTLLKAAGGLLTPTAGGVLLEGEAPGAMPNAHRARRIAYLAAETPATWPLSVYRTIALGRIPHLKPLRRLAAADHQAVAKALDQAGIAHLATRSISDISSGERARVHLARVLATQAQLILLDEPTAALDPHHQVAVMELVRDEAERGRTVIMCVHALDLAARYADRVLMLNAGQFVAEGAPQDVLSEANLETVFGVRAPGGVQPSRFERIS